MSGLREISKACNVSMATVSRVLNNDLTLSVSLEVKEAILREAENLSYKTPRQRALESKLLLKYKVGLVLQGMDVMGTDSKLVSMLSPIASSYGISLSLFNVEEDYSDALILIGSFSRDEVDFYLNYADKLLFVNELENDYQHDSIMIDYSVSPRLAYEYFMNKGIRKIGYLGGLYERNGQVVGRKRIESFKAKLESNGLYDPSLFHVGKMTRESGQSLMEKCEDIPEGILFGDRQVMEGAMDVLKRKNVHPVCLLYENFFDTSYGENAVLKIFASSVWMTAFRMLMERLDGSRTQGIHVFCPPQLEIRE